jgi:hypothetical protein
VARCDANRQRPAAARASNPDLPPMSHEPESVFSEQATELDWSHRAALIDFIVEGKGIRPKRGTFAMTYTVDPRVDAYIDALPDWQQIICREVRDLVHAADREVTETIKFTNRPYFVLQGNICALLAAKDHVNVFLYDGAIVPDPERIITAGHENKTARTVAVRQGETINASALTAMFKQIIANNKAGGWRKLKR